MGTVAPQVSELRATMTSQSFKNVGRTRVTADLFKSRRPKPRPESAPKALADLSSAYDNQRQLADYNRLMRDTEHSFRLELF